MEKLSLAALLDEDREMVSAALAADRALPSAQAALEKEIDRVMYRYVEGCPDEALRQSAQHILQAVKNTLPVMDTVGEARAWKKEAESPRRGGLSLRPVTLIMLLAGAVLIFGAVLGVLISGRYSDVLAFIKALLPVALGGGALYWAGVQSARPKKRGAGRQGEEQTRTEYLVDVEKAWHCLRGVMLQADGQLERIREDRAATRQREADAASESRLSPGELELFGELLETAYASADDGARESASAIRFYLHNAGIDVTDYEAGRENWFEFLPAGKPGTIRPAMISEGKLLKKGLASAKR